MTADQVLLLGLSLVFAAVVAPVAALALTGGRRAQVVRSLEGIARLQYGGGNHVVAPELGARERLLLPLLRHLTGLGRRLTPKAATDRLAQRLDLAGNPPGLDVERLLALKGAGLLAGATAGLVMVPGGLKVLAAPVAALFGFYVADLLLTNRGQKRQLDMQRSLPDALDLLTISVEAGLAFDAALSQVARKTTGPLAGEFFRVLQEMQIGKTRAAAFRGMAERTTVAEFARFSSAIVQADGLGVPLGGVLREQAAEMRLKRSQRAEEQAHKVPVKILFPMVAFLLPAIFVIIIGPGAITILKTIG